MARSPRQRLRRLDWRYDVQPLVLLAAAMLSPVVVFLVWLAVGSPRLYDASQWPMWAQVTFGLGLAVIGFVAVERIGGQQKRRTVHYVRVIVDQHGREVRRYSDESECKDRRAVRAWIERMDRITDEAEQRL